MRLEHRWRGILNFRSSHVTGGKTLGFGELDKVQLRIAVDVDVDRVVVGLGAGSPSGARSRGVGHGSDDASVLVNSACLRILAIAGAGAQRESGVLAGAGFRSVQIRLANLVKAIERTIGTMQVITGNRDFRITHAVADEENNVFRRGVTVHTRNALGATVLGQCVNTLAVLRKGHTGERLHHGKRSNCRTDCLQLILHYSSFRFRNNR